MADWTGAEWPAWPHGNAQQSWFSALLHQPQHLPCWEAQVGAAAGDGWAAPMQGTKNKTGPCWPQVSGNIPALPRQCRHRAPLGHPNRERHRVRISPESMARTRGGAQVGCSTCHAPKRRSDANSTKKPPNSAELKKVCHKVLLSREPAASSDPPPPLSRPLPLTTGAWILMTQSEQVLMRCHAMPLHPSIIVDTRGPSGFLFLCERDIIFMWRSELPSSNKSTRVPVDGSIPYSARHLCEGL
jgi:hypothetical protein